MKTEDESTIVLTRRESLRLLDLIENPPPRNERFKQAMADYQKGNRDGSDSSVDWSPRRDGRIAQATSKDVGAIAAVHHVCFPRQHDSEKWVACQFAAYPLMRIYVTSEEGQIVGYIVWGEKSGFRDAVVLELEQIGIIPEIQRRGLGSALIASSLRQVEGAIQARGARVESIVVTTGANNAAQDLYRRCLNAEVAGTIPHLFNGTDEVVMVSRAWSRS